MVFVREITKFTMGQLNLTDSPASFRIWWQRGRIAVDKVVLSESNHGHLNRGEPPFKAHSEKVPMADLAAFIKMDALALAPLLYPMLAFKTSTFAPPALGAIEQNSGNWGANALSYL